MRNDIKFDLHGKTAGVVGTGQIGAFVARALNGFGCRVLAHDKSENPDWLQHERATQAEVRRQEADLKQAPR